MMLRSKISFNFVSTFVLSLVLSVFAAAIGNANAQQQIPSSLQVVGTIIAGGGVTPAQNDIVQIVRPDRLNSVEGQGTVLANDGTFVVDMAKTQDFNGTQLTAIFKKGNSVYQLNNGTTPLVFPYSGTFPFPSRINFNLTIGTRISGGGTTPPTDDPGSDNDAYDVNGDGVFNQADIDVIKAQLGEPNPLAAADVNGDNLVNTRDAIDAIRALNAAGRLRQPAASTTTTTQ